MPCPVNLKVIHLFHRFPALARPQLGRHTALIPALEPVPGRTGHTHALVAQAEGTALGRQRTLPDVVAREIRKALFPPRAAIRVGLEIAVGAEPYERERGVVVECSEDDLVAFRRRRGAVVFVDCERELVSCEVVVIRRLAIEDNGGCTLCVAPTTVSNEPATVVQVQVQTLVIEDEAVGSIRAVLVRPTTYELVAAIDSK